MEMDNFNISNSSIDFMDNETFPEYLTFNENSLWTVIVYCVLFLVAAVGNLTVFISLFRSRNRKSRISLMIRHLAIADLMVTFIMIPLEVNYARLNHVLYLPNNSIHKFNDWVLVGTNE